VRAIDSITSAIIGDAIAVHRELGPGLLESTYEACLTNLLSRRGLQVERQVAMPLIFQGESIDCAYRLDLFISLMDFVASCEDITNRLFNLPNPRRPLRLIPLAASRAQRATAL
jgi:hypothetical protein